MPKTKLIRADCLKRMRSMEPDSVDTIITDPPYGLEFMGKAWDKFGGGRTSKPGIGKRSTSWPNNRGWNEHRCTNCGHLSHGGSPCKCKNPKFKQDLSRWYDYQNFMYKWATEALRVAKPGAFLLCFGGTRTFHRLAVSIEDAGWEIRDCIMWVYGTGFPKSHNISKAIDKKAGKIRRVVGTKLGRPGYSLNQCDNPGGVAMSGNVDNSLRNPEAECSVTAPSTKSAKEWDGYGTALKPAWEPIIVAMKPLDGTFANNVLKHGTGGLNIDRCRVPGVKPQVTQGINSNPSSFNVAKSRQLSGDSSIGRWPANLIHDGSDEVVQGFPLTSSGNLLPKHKLSASENVAMSGPNQARNPRQEFGGDSGSAARFFYCAKASKKERGKGNNHPTVKPLKLMEYLCLLTRTPKGGVVLDPFMGSGTTGIACKNTKRSFVGIEKDRKYFLIAKGRIRRRATT